jgi:hypothetical protein
MVNYKNAVIYSIRTGDSIYIGSTCSFKSRKAQHKTLIHNENHKSYNLNLYKTIRDNGGQWDMKPYSVFPCENKTQLTIEEERIRVEMKADLNMVSCCFDKEKRKKWCNENKEQIKEVSKKYRDENKEQIKESSKKYRDENKEQIKERMHNWRNNNKQHIKEYGGNWLDKNRERINKQRREKAKVTCECGCVLVERCLSTHRKSKKHFQLLEEKMIE